MISEPDPAGADAVVPDAAVDIEVELLLEAVFRRYQQDFRRYARSSLRRRLLQAVARFDCGSISELQGRVLRDARLFGELMQYLTVQVSEMFRDPSYFRALREQVLPHLATHPFLKVWVAGCSMGEEVWSLLILLREEGLLERTVLYATDINPVALEAARAGIYPNDRMAGFSRSYLAAGGRGSLSDHYRSAYGHARLDPTLAAQVVFSDHSLATDAVFSETHLVSCRNVLIYFERPLQDRALGLFVESLVHGGFLGLGSRESLRFSAHASAFADFDRDQRIYRRR